MQLSEAMWMWLTGALETWPSQSIALLHDHRLAFVMVGRVKRADWAELLSVCITRCAPVTMQEKINERGFTCNKAAVSLT